MKGMETSICSTPPIKHAKGLAVPSTYEDDIKRLVPLHPRPESIDGQLSVLCDLNTMAILFEDLHCQFLVDQVILGNEDVVWYILRSDNRCDRVRLQSCDEC